MVTKEITIIFTDGTKATFSKMLSWTRYYDDIKFYFVVDSTVNDVTYKVDEIAAICKGIVDTYDLE